MIDNRWTVKLSGRIFDFCLCFYDFRGLTFFALVFETWKTDLTWLPNNIFTIAPSKYFLCLSYSRSTPYINILNVWQFPKFGKLKSIEVLIFSSSTLSFLVIVCMLHSRLWVTSFEIEPKECGIFQSTWYVNHYCWWCKSQLWVWNSLLFLTLCKRHFQGACFSQVCFPSKGWLLNRCLDNARRVIRLKFQASCLTFDFLYFFQVIDLDSTWDFTHWSLSFGSRRTGKCSRRCLQVFFSKYLVLLCMTHTIESVDHSPALDQGTLRCLIQNFSETKIFVLSFSLGMVMSEMCTRDYPFADVMLEKSELVQLLTGKSDDVILRVWNDYIARLNIEAGGWVRPCIKDKEWPSKYEKRKAFKKVNHPFNIP